LQQLAATAQMAEAIPPEVRDILTELGPVSSETELEEKLRQRPDLREKLEALQQAALLNEMDLADQLIEWVQTPTWSDSQAYLENHLELLADEAEQVLVRLSEVQDDEGARRTLVEHLALLRRCRSEGIEAAFAEKTSGELPPELRRAVEALGPELGQQLLEIIERVSSQEEFEAELEKHPQLREALASASGGPGLGDVPPDIAPILQELARLAGRADMPRRIELCRQALRRVDRGINPRLWATLQVELGNSLAQNPLGERAENIERAIETYQQALEVRTRQAMPVEWARTMMNLANAYRDRIRGERAENIERAIETYQQALQVNTRQAMPVEWAQTVNNLALAYRNRIRGERAENIERAIEAYQQALQVRTRQTMPVEWERTIMNLANA
jgi:tetratricopeptide (TPR) repeat protein